MIFLNRVFILRAWSVIIALGLFFLDNAVAYFFGYRRRIFGNSFFHKPAWVSTHMIGGHANLAVGSSAVLAG